MVIFPTDIQQKKNFESGNVIESDIGRENQKNKMFFRIKKKTVLNQW